MRKDVLLAGAALMVLALSQPGGAEGATVTIGSTYVKDATIFANNTGNSNGAGPGMFVGGNNNVTDTLRPRRGLLKFDVVAYDGANSNILTTATAINSVTLKLDLGMAAGSGGGNGLGGGTCPGGDSSNRVIDIYRLKDVTSPSSTGNWGESASTGSSSQIGGTGQGASAGTDDATWTSRRHSSNPNWAAAGANSDHEASVSATATVGGGGTCPATHQWSSAGLLADVKAWLGYGVTQIDNRGWILINQEETDSQTFRAYWTKEGEALGYFGEVNMARGW